MIQPNNLQTGQPFTAKIKGRKVVGKITEKNGNVYLCQNYFDGAYISERHGYKYSWQWDGQVTEFKTSSKTLEKEALGAPISVWEVGSIDRYSIEVGCQKISKKDIVGFRKIVDIFLGSSGRYPGAKEIKQMLEVANLLKFEKPRRKKSK